MPWPLTRHSGVGHPPGWGPGLGGGAQATMAPEVGRPGGATQEVDGVMRWELLWPQQVTTFIGAA